MVKVKVFIDNEGFLFDNEIFVIAVLPCVPRVGESLYLSRKEIDTLAIDISLMSENVEDYKKWFIDFNEDTKYNHKYIDLNAAYIVHKVAYDTSQDCALICLTDDKIKNL
jgi:hypothetical protein